MEKYLYKVNFGVIEKGEVIRNWSSKNVIAKDAQDAINKAKLGKGFFPEEVREIGAVDVA